MKLRRRGGGSAPCSGSPGTGGQGGTAEGASSHPLQPLGFNSSYTYGPVAWRILFDRLRRPRRPTFHIESHYEADFGKRTADDVRVYPYRAILAGAAGHLFGNRPLWYCGEDWEAAVDSPGSRFMGHVRAWWFDPRGGQATEIGCFDRSGLRLFEAPEGGDWILVIDDDARSLPAPGRSPPSRSPSNSSAQSAGRGGTPRQALAPSVGN